MGVYRVFVELGFEASTKYQAKEYVWALTDNNVNLDDAVVYADVVKAEWDKPESYRQAAKRERMNDDSEEVAHGS